MTLFPSGSIAVVTGGGRGLGAAITAALVDEGVDVLVTYRSDEAAACRTVAQLSDRPGTATAYRVDISDEDSVKSFFRLVRRQYGRLDTLINNAGITSDGLVMAMSVANFRKVLDVNLVGTFLCSREALRIMANQGSGSIINISSGTIFRGGWGQANYTASKGAIVSFTQSLALEAAQYNVRAATVSPGFIHTDMTRGLPAHELGPEIPIGRLAAPEEIAAAVVFASSPKASYLTGTNLLIDGGACIVGLPPSRLRELTRRKTGRRSMNGRLKGSHV